MISNVKVVIMLVLAAAMTYLVLTNVMPQTTNISVSNQSVLSWTNGTTQVGNTPIYTDAPYVPTLKWANGTTDVKNYTFTTSGVTLLGGEANGTYYAYYTYYKQPWIAGTNYVWALSVFTFIMAAAILAKFMGLF